jgi:CRP-like cAMP-binding protein
LLSHGPRTASVEATQTSVLIKISSGSLDQLLVEQPALAAQFLHHLAKSLGRQLGDLTAKLRAGAEQKEILSYL